MQEAFEKYMEDDGCISIFSLYESIKDKQLDTIYSKLFFEMIRRICEFPEVHNDTRIDFDQFSRFVKRAMNMR